jgi:pimeloyl-ACP methyl ester carboxylesterase
MISQVAEGQPHVEGVEHRYVDVAAGDGPLRVHLAEAGEGEPVLLLHGWPQHWFLWRKVVPLVAPHRRMLMPDLRGFGWTAAPGRGYDPETFAADAIALLDTLGLERVQLAGHDWGGYTSLLAGLHHPERFTRILSMNVPVPWTRPSPALLRQSAMSWYAGLNALPWLGRRVHERSPSWVAWTLRRALVDPHAISAGEAGIFARRYLPAERARAAQLLYRAYHRAFAEVLVGRRYDELRLTVPARMVFGTRDVFISPALTEGWEGHADDFAVEFVDDSGHFIVDEKPDLVARRALAFLS